MKTQHGVNTVTVICDMPSCLRRLSFVLTGFCSPSYQHQNTDFKVYAHLAVISHVGKDAARLLSRQTKYFPSRPSVLILNSMLSGNDAKFVVTKRRMYVSGRGSSQIFENFENEGHATPIERRYSRGNNLKSEHALPSIHHLPLAWHSAILGNLCSWPVASGLRIAL